ncbi:hypothetical protein IWW56_000752 [Coemansia sp. RSA 2131]|nr:hypothetical protein IWW56_000752 [Coemansia sp. RSA 2131]
MPIIRKQQTSFWDGVRDWVLHLVEDYELIDWNRISEATSWPCALAFNGLFILVSLGRQISSRSSDLDVILDTDHRRRPVPGGTHRWDSAHIDYNTFSEHKSSTWASILLFLQVLLYLISIVNTWRLFSTRRTYQLRMADPATALMTSSCRRVPLGTRRPNWAHSFVGRGVWAIWKRIARIDDQIQGEIWELSIWTPVTFSRNLFCWYSPVQLLILSFMNGSNWYYILPLAAAVAVQCTFIVVTYSRLVKDKQILFGEMYNEYNEKFVNPRVFAPKSDAATSTMEDWALSRKADSSTSNFNSARSNLERIRRGDSARRRTTALASGDPNPRDYVRRDVYRRATGYEPPRAAEPVPAPYVNAYNPIAERRVHRTDARDNVSYQNGHIDSRHSGIQASHDEPIGTHRVRDRSARRRRHTELVENAKYGR